MVERWHCPAIPNGPVRRLTHGLGISTFQARLLVQRGIEEPGEAKAYLNPRLRELHDPFRLVGMEACIARLVQALERNERVLVFGDYDVDGLTSTAILTGLLRKLGLSVQTFVPRRLGEGYGLTPLALARAFGESPPNLVLAVDCGTHCGEVFPWLQERGSDLVIIDHHTEREESARPEAFVNPNVRGGEGAEFSAAGLAFKVSHALVKTLREEGNEIAEKVSLKDDLDLVALGTIADLVPLRGENRTLVRAGLKMLARRLRPGLSALMEIASVETAGAVATEDVNFRLGPRLNASGRLAEADLPLELLLTKDAARATELAGELDLLNRQRQQLEAEITASAIEQAEREGYDGAGLVFYDPSWHAGVVGIVASRLAGYFQRPCVVLGRDTETDEAKGSGRSVVGVNLIEALKPCAEELTGWGGHPMAAGVNLPVESIAAFRENFAQATEQQRRKQPYDATLTLATWIQARELTGPLHHDVEALQPFGSGNPAPLLGLRRITLTREPEVFAEKHLRFPLELRPGSKLQTIMWGGADRPPPAGTPIDLAVQCTWNAWKGRRSPRLEVKAWRPHTTD